MFPYKMCVTEKKKYINKLKIFFYWFCCQHPLINYLAINAEPFSPVQTCLVCGKSTNLLQDIPLEAIKKMSSEACETLVRGQWSKGLELAQKTEEMVKKHFSLPVLEVTQVQISIWKCLWLVHGSMRLVKTMSWNIVNKGSNCVAYV